MKILSIINLLLLFTLSIVGAEKIYKLEGINRGIFIVVKDSRAFITDDESIKIVDLKTGKIVKTVGSKGEGPNEFKTYPSLHLYKNRILACSLGKISEVSLSGEIIREIKAPLVNEATSITDIGYTGIKFKNGRNKRFEICFNTYDKDFKVLKTMYSFSMMDNNRKYRLFQHFTFVDAKGDRIIYNELNNYAISFHDAEGNLIKRVTREPRNIPFTEKHEAYIRNVWKEEKDEFRMKRVAIPEYFAEIYQTKLCNDHYYVLTFIMQDGKRECLVYDLDGNYKKTIFIPMVFEDFTHIHVFTFANNRFYWLYEDVEAEVWKLKISDIDEKIPSLPTSR